MGSAPSFLGEYANMILMRCGALHLTFVGPLPAGASVPGPYLTEQSSLRAKEMIGLPSFQDLPLAAPHSSK